MKRVVSLLLVVLMVIPTISLAEESKAAEKPRNSFKTEDECEAALKSGKFEAYNPSVTTHKNDDPVNGVDRIMIPAETTMCMNVDIVGGARYIVVLEETELRARKNPDGSLAVYALNSCGNKIHNGPVIPAPASLVGSAERVAAAASLPSDRPVNQMTSEKKGGIFRSKWFWAGVVVGGGAVGFALSKTTKVTQTVIIH